MPELSMDAKKELIRGKLDPENEYKIWVGPLYDEYVIIEEDGRNYKLYYTISDSNEITLGERKEVVGDWVELGELKNVEALRVGTFTSMSGKRVTYTDADLEEIAVNGEKLADTIIAPFVATHEEGSDATLQVFGSVTGGMLSNYRKEGDILFVDINGVPEKGIDLLKEVKLLRTSPEIYDNFMDDEGNAHGKVLRRFSWVDIPADKSKAGITEANLFEESQDQPTTWIRLNEPPQSKKRKEKKDMSIDLSKMKEEEILKLGESDIAGLSEGDARYVTLLQESADLKKENKSHEIKLSEHAQSAKTAQIDAIVAKFQDKESKDVLAPAAMDSIKQFAESLDSTTMIKLGEGDDEKEATTLDMFGDLLGNLIQRSDKGTLVVHLGEMAHDTEKLSEENPVVANAQARADAQKK